MFRNLKIIRHMNYYFNNKYYNYFKNDSLYF